MRNHFGLVGWGVRTGEVVVQQTLTQTDLGFSRTIDQFSFFLDRSDFVAVIFERASVLVASWI